MPRLAHASSRAHWPSCTTWQLPAIAKQWQTPFRCPVHWFSTIVQSPFTVTTTEFVHNTLLPFSWPARSWLGTAVRGIHAEWMEWTGMTFWQLHGRPWSRPAIFSRSGAPCILNCQIYGHHSQFVVHRPDFTFESGIYVRPVIYRGSDNVYGDSFYCVYLWGRTVTTEHTLAEQKCVGVRIFAVRYKCVGVRTKCVEC